jgi:hypothetical protein
MEEVYAVWRAITAPVLWIAAADSHIPKWLNDHPEGEAATDSLDGVRRRLARVPHGRLEVIADASHMLHHDQPARALQRLSIVHRVVMAHRNLIVCAPTCFHHRHDAPVPPDLSHPDRSRLVPVCNAGGAVNGIGSPRSPRSRSALGLVHTESTPATVQTTAVVAYP